MDTVVFDEQAVAMTWASGQRHVMQWSQLGAVSIVTTDAGPFVEDVFLVLGDGETEILIPHGAQGFQGLLARLAQLPGRNDAEVIKAMGCTSNRRFECWKRSAEPMSS